MSERPGYPLPDHLWNGDDLGHNCADCDRDSPWVRDRPRHHDPRCISLTEHGLRGECDCRVWALIDSGGKPANA